MHMQFLALGALAATGIAAPMEPLISSEQEKQIEVMRRAMLNLHSGAQNGLSKRGIFSPLCIAACTPLLITTPAYLACVAGCAATAADTGEVAGVPIVQDDGTVSFVSGITHFHADGTLGVDTDGDGTEDESNPPLENNTPDPPLDTSGDTGDLGDTFDSGDDTSDDTGDDTTDTTGNDSTDTSGDDSTDTSEDDSTDTSGDDTTDDSGDSDDTSGDDTTDDSGIEDGGSRRRWLF